MPHPLRKRLIRLAVASALAALLGSAAAVAYLSTRGSSRSAERVATLRTIVHRPVAPPPRHRVRGAHDAAVPILMYHVIAPPGPNAPYSDLYVRPGDFAAQMRWLGRHGYHGVTLRQVYDYWSEGFALPRKPIVISFDDGYRSTYSVAFPVLRGLRWPGVVNLEFAHTRTRWGLPPRLIRMLGRAGWEIDAHTLTHPDLTTLDPVRLRREVAGSRTAIRRAFHLPVDFFCYPSGRYDDAVVAAVRAAGYLGATTTEYGLAKPSEAFTLDRVRVNGSDGVSGFARKLTSLS